MKNICPKKGKVHPSPPSDACSVLKLLPAAVLALASALMIEDKEVLAYLIAHSLNASLNFPENKKKCRRSHLHKPVFDCGCFDCYTSFWIRWDASPSRELIHDVIDAFEEHLATAEGSAKTKGKNKKTSSSTYSAMIKDRSFWTKMEGKVLTEPTNQLLPENPILPEKEQEVVNVVPTSAAPESSSPEISVYAADESINGDVDDQEIEDFSPASTESEEMEESETDEKCVVGAVPTLSGRSLVRKLIPDVMGFFASRLWTV